MAEEIKNELNDEEINEEEMMQSEQEVATEEEETKQTNLSGIEGVEEGIKGGIEDTELGKQIKDSFLDYAMSVIVSRALPDARDGFKPVHRRVIYGMVKMKLYPNVPHKKSARITGDVMGKYHPHGDSAIYSSLARLAQPFAMRYPLVDGHGNFGNQDGDEPAAARYTEARLSKISLEMVRDITKNTVNFSPTYDGDSEEPDVLPSRFPNLLVNGSSGIAVGMATNIPPHNLKEAINAVIAVIKNPEISALDLMNNHIYGPDFPNGGVIIGRSGIRNYFETGQGSIKVRAKYHVETKNDRDSIIFTELPYMVNKKELAKKIVELVDNKTLDGISNIADYSSYKVGTKFVVELKKGANTEIVLNHLFKYTKLQDSFAVNLLALDHGVPKVLSMKQALQIYANFQKDVIKRRTIHDKKSATDRLHIIEGMLVVKDNTDEVVQIIRSSDNDSIAATRLQERFNLDQIQTDAILQMPLRRLTKLDGIKFVDEKNDLTAAIAKYDNILANEKVLEEVLISELEEIKNKYGDDRRTEIVDAELSEEDEDLIEDKEILISLTKTGYIKRMSPDNFRVQNRGGVGVIGMQTKQDDVVEILTHSRTKVDTLFFTSLGKVYRMRGYMIPEGSRTSKGIPIINFLQLDSQRNEKVLAIIPAKVYDENHYLFFVTKQAIVKRVSTKEFSSIHQNGKIAISLKDNDELFDVKYTDGTSLISIASKKGKLCTFNETDVRAMGRTAAGVIGMNLDNSEVVGVSTSLEGDMILSLSSLGKGKMTPLTEYRITGRGGKGVKTMGVNEEEDITLVGIKAVHGNENLLVMTDGGTVIKTSLNDISTNGRGAKGVNIIKLKEDEQISSMTIEPTNEDYQAKDDPSLDTVDTNKKNLEDELLHSMQENENPDDEV